MAKLRALYRTKKGKKELKGYYGEWYDSNRRPAQKRHSLRTKNKQAARQKLAKLEYQEAHGLFDPWNDSIRSDGTTVSEGIEHFIKSRKKHCSPATVDTYRYVLGAFEKSVPPAFPLYGTTEKHIAEFLRQDLAEATIASYRDRLRIFFGWAKDEGYCKANPVPEKGRGKKSRMKGSSVPEFLSEDEFARLLRAISADAQMKNLPHGNAWLLDTVRFAAGTGLRRGEILHLRWEAVDFHAGMMRVQNNEEFTTKSGRERSVPLVGDALSIVRRLYADRKDCGAKEYVFQAATGGRINGNYLSQRFRYYRRLAKLPENISFHSLRHTFASWFVLRGGDLYRLKEILGHADMKTTLKYAHLRPDALRAEMDKTFGRAYEENRSPIDRLRQKLGETG